MEKDTMLGKVVRMLVTVPADWLGTLADLFEKLTGSDGKMWLSALKRFLRKEYLWGIFHVFRTLTLGLHKSVPAYIAALESVGLLVDEIARLMCEKVTVSSEQASYELYVATTAELGFLKGATLAQISARVVELGYQLCPAEVGLALRLAYQDQPLNEWLRIVMEPISVSDGRPSVFRVAHDGFGQWLLGGGWLRPDCVWYPGSRWVFCRPAVVGAGK